MMIDRITSQCTAMYVHIATRQLGAINVILSYFLTADLAHLRPRHPEMTHLWEAKASSRNQAEVCLRATPRAMPA